MKSRFSRKLVKRATMVAVLLLVMAILFASQVQPVYAQCGGPMTLDEWVKGATTVRVRECLYTFDGSAGQYVTIRMERDNGSPRLDPYLDLYLGLKDPKYPYGIPVAFDDDSAGNGNSLIDGYQLPNTGTYTIIAHSYSNQTYGVYWIYTTLSQ